jgi:prepilin-type N-terminal cleavage/methylation domain-containing protein
MKKSGFTLIELIFVIVIIGLLAAVAVPKFLATKKRAETANFPEVANQIVTKANEQYSLIGTHDLKGIITGDPDLKTYVKDINDTSEFNVSDLNSTGFKIVYMESNGSVGATCLEINASNDEVNISSSKQIKAYNFIVKELNTSCNQE